MRNLSPVKQKILLLLLGGLTLSLSRSPGRYFKILGKMGKEWSRIEKEKLKNSIRELYQSKLISLTTSPDGSMTMVLNIKGKNKALRYNIEKLKIPEQKWDGRWRIVIFDIPESRREARNALRVLLKKMSFIELQKSVFIHPYECKNEIEFIVEFFQLNRNVRYGVLNFIDNELHLRHIFRDLIVP